MPRKRAPESTTNPLYVNVRAKHRVEPGDFQVPEFRFAPHRRKPYNQQLYSFFTRTFEANGLQLGLDRDQHHCRLLIRPGSLTDILVVGTVRTAKDAIERASLRPSTHNGSFSSPVTAVEQYILRTVPKDTTLPQDFRLSMYGAGLAVSTSHDGTSFDGAPANIELFSGSEHFIAEPSPISSADNLAAKQAYLSEWHQKLRPTIDLLKPFVATLEN